MDSLELECTLLPAGSGAGEAATLALGGGGAVVGARGGGGDCVDQERAQKVYKTDQRMREQSSARSVEWRGLSWSTGVMVCGAAEICVSWGRQLLPALPDFGPEHPNSRLRDTSCPPIITEHFATISSGCGGARTRSAVVMSSALAEQPPGELPVMLGAAPRLGALIEVPAMQWGQFLRKRT